MVSLALVLVLQGSSIAVMPPNTVRSVVVTPVKAEKGGNKDDLVCKSENPMGSKIPVKTCYNKQEYQQRRLEDRRQLERIQADVRAPSGG